MDRLPIFSELYFVSEDADYQSKVNSELFSPFLMKEWLQEKNGTVYFFKRLSSFFKDKFPEIELASDVEKFLLIQKLGGSRNFAKTRSILTKLAKFSDFSLSEVKAIIDASISNNQVYWIMEDIDINRILLNIVKGHENELDEEALKKFQIYLGVLKAEDDLNSVEEVSGSDTDDDMPF